MDKSINCRNKRSGGMGLMLYAKGSNLDYDASLRKATMFGKPCIVMIELLQN
jgi:hypothetical protein